MIGFDRPLKPSWIYNFIQLIEIGDRLSDHKTEFNNILWELEGVEGKRKVRTVLSRYFLKSENNPKSKIVEYTPIIEVCKHYKLEEVQSIILFHLLMRSSTLRILTKIINEIYGSKDDINYLFLRKKVIERFGERDISSRSLRNFLSTLVHFDVLIKTDNNKYRWKNKLNVSEMNACYLLKLYAEEFKKSPQINLEEFEYYLLLYFNMPDIDKIIRKYNRILWEYSMYLGKRTILFHDYYKWDKEKMDQLFEADRIIISGIK